MEAVPGKLFPNEGALIMKKFLILPCVLALAACSGASCDSDDTKALFNQAAKDSGIQLIGEAVEASQYNFSESLEYVHEAKKNVTYDLINVETVSSEMGSSVCKAVVINDRNDAESVVQYQIDDYGIWQELTVDYIDVFGTF